ncbi:uncharacterized protein LOC128642065 [Bombina bombina]|uniref:uncharacterized protein LOC128642065 n=1 Tax=Bombina bombina TaxID=8345 RepID=UPI00235A76E8|nr:uncharacterized protein LOC128642065 [Bombina bombina]
MGHWRMDGLKCLCFLFLHQTSVRLAMTASTYSALAGSDVLLSCTFTVNNPPKSFLVQWYFENKEILSFDGKLKSFRSRVSLNEEAAMVGDVSLNVSKVTISDGGLYRCLIDSSEKKETEIVLDVQAQPKITIPNKVVFKDQENILNCTVTGFYPPDIDVIWLIDGKTMQNSHLGIQTQNPDETYDVNSTVTIIPKEGDKNKTFSCIVHHPTLQKPIQEDFQLIYGDQSKTNYLPLIIPLIIIGGIFVFVVLGVVIGVWFKRTKNRKDLTHFQMTNIKHPGKLIDDVEVTLKCTALQNLSQTGFASPGREGFFMTWLENKSDNKMRILNSLNEKKERKKLLNLYTVTQQKEIQNAALVINTNLTFTPRVITHKDVNLICRTKCGNTLKSEQYSCSENICAIPQFSEPIKTTLCDWGDIQFTLKLERFYPKDIQIKWRCSDLYKTVNHTQTFNEDPSDFTFSVQSDCKIPGQYLKNPNCKVFVTWEHKSMDNPESKELATTDITWKPQIIGFSTHKLPDTNQVSVKCQIINFFPDALKVTWFSKGKGSQELSDGDSYKIPNITVEKQSDNTYNCTASLVFTPNSEQNEEFFCQLEHPTLKQPIKQCSGPLNITG